MKKERVFMKKEGIQPAQLGDELAMLNVDSGEYFVINEVGKDVWEQIDGKKNIQQVIEELIKIYDADSEAIEKDVSVFLKELEEAKVISEVQR
jgi:hypothetical protein